MLHPEEKEYIIGLLEDGKKRGFLDLPEDERSLIFDDVNKSLVRTGIDFQITTEILNQFNKDNTLDL